jgi:hypothetical protein
MDLLSALKAAHHLGEAARELSQSSPPHPWETDEDAFLQHFGVPYEDFLEIAALLSTEQRELLQKTLEVNPEAAVLWILSMDVVT